MEYVQYIAGSEPAGKMLNALSGVLGPVRFDQWFGSAATIRLTETTLIFCVKNQFCADWIRSNLMRNIEELIQTIFGKPYQVSFEFETAKQAEKKTVKTAKLPVIPSVPRRELVVCGTVRELPSAAQKTFAFHADYQPAFSRATAPAAAAKTKPQKTGRTFAALETFVEGHSNRLAVRAADLAVNHPGEINPIYVHGGTSTGKTHLLEGIWSAVRRRSSDGKMPMYLSCEQFVSAFLDSIPKAGFSRDKVNDFRSRFRSISVFLLDDIQYLAGKGATQSEFLILFDQLRQKGVQLVFTGNKPLKELQGLRSEIISRLESGMVCEIKQPERETAYKILCSEAARRKLPLGTDVCRMAASRLGSNARQLIGALNILHASYLATGKMPSLEQAEELLGDLIRNNQRNVRLPDIEKAVCETFGIAEESLHSKSRAKQIAAPRMIAMWLARKFTRSALSEIGQYFGGRSHSTVLTAQKKVDQWVDAAHPVHADRLVLPISEAIQRIENQLR
ncbi:MAG: chromosomal replication initiator protein DnaA [Planctomycetaceae bacterium]|jgi:chromosomal replication initiator protein|nr:chromosomal replication initiator protein DnaA [Planctomycetaceae bacterium]